MLPVAQLASVLGVYGLSALVALVNALIACALISVGRRRIAVLASAALVPLACAGWGAWRMQHDSLVRSGEQMSVGIVQANIDQETKWEPSRCPSDLFTPHRHHPRRRPPRCAPRLVAESSVPFRFNDDAIGKGEMQQLVRELGITLLFGSDEEINGNDVYNSAFLLSPAGQTLAVYRKIHLVPFGEFIPTGRGSRSSRRSSKRWAASRRSHQARQW
jgi:apolipoprotein N-acyltransferase